MEAERTSETSVYIDLRTRQYIPEGSELHIRRRENLKFHMALYSSDDRHFVLQSVNFLSVYSIGSEIVGRPPPPGALLVLWGGASDLFVWATYLFWTKYGRRITYILW
jgi:hypothetical protein